MKRDAKKGGPKVVTANALDTGWVVFLKADGGWTRDVAQAAVAADAEVATALEAQGQAAVAHNLVIDAYLVEVKDVDGRRVPVLLREAIRAAGGPTASTLHRMASGAVV